MILSYLGATLCKLFKKTFSYQIRNNKPKQPFYEKEKEPHPTHTF